jgi:hypothetical protein
MVEFLICLCACFVLGIIVCFSDDYPTLFVMFLVLLVLNVVWLVISGNQPAVTSSFKIYDVYTIESSQYISFANKKGGPTNINIKLRSAVPDGAKIKVSKVSGWYFGIHWSDNVCSPRYEIVDGDNNG